MILYKQSHLLLLLALPSLAWQDVLIDSPNGLLTRGTLYAV